LARVIHVEEEEHGVLQDIERELAELAHIAGVAPAKGSAIDGNSNRLCSVLGGLTGSIQRRILEEEGRTQR